MFYLSNPPGGVLVWGRREVHDGPMESSEESGKQNVPAWVEALAGFLRAEPGVEAVRVERESKKVTVATLGAVDEAQWRARLAEALEGLDAELQATRVRSMRLPGGLRVRSEGGTVTLEKPSCPTSPQLWRWNQGDWPVERAKGRDHDEDDHEGHDHDNEWKVLTVQAALCGIFGLLGVGLGSWWPEMPWVARAAFLVALIAGGREAAEEAWPRLRRGKLDIHFLMLAVAIGAVAIGAWAEGVLLLFLFSASGAMEHFAEARTRRELAALFASQPKVALRVEADGTEVEVPVEDVKPGDRLRVRPGDLFAVDGELVDGRTAVDESTLTGESAAVDKEVGDPVFSGTLNQQGSVIIEVSRPVQDSALQKIIRMVKEAQGRRAPSQRLTDRFGTPYTILILGLTAALFLFRWLALGDAPFLAEEGERSAFYRAMTLLVTASPCALVLSIPSAILAAMAWGAKRGILFRGGEAVERLAAVKTVALDKTGTLTTGEMEVVSIESFPPGQEAAVAALVMGMEEHSTHPIARAIVADSKRKGVVPTKVTDMENFPGFGLAAMTPEGKAVLGRRELLAKQPLGAFIADVAEPEFQEQEVWLVAPERIGRVLLRDRVRPEAAGLLRALEAAGLRTVMLTGDRKETAEAVGRELGLTEVRAALRPEDKLAAIEELKKLGPVAMVGDGVNDAPSLAAADVPVAMGARGSDAALEQALIVLMQDRLERFLDAYELSRRARRIIRQNLAISLGTVLLASLAAVAGVIPLSVGVVAHEGSTVLVCLNSLRLLFHRAAAVKTNMD